MTIKHLMHPNTDNHHNNWSRQWQWQCRAKPRAKPPKGKTQLDFKKYWRETREINSTFNGIYCTWSPRNLCSPFLQKSTVHMACCTVLSYDPDLMLSAATKNMPRFCLKLHANVAWFPRQITVVRSSRFLCKSKMYIICCTESVWPVFVRKWYITLLILCVEDILGICAQISQRFLSPWNLNASSFYCMDFFSLLSLTSKLRTCFSWCLHWSLGYLMITSFTL